MSRISTPINEHGTQSHPAYNMLHSQLSTTMGSGNSGFLHEQFQVSHMGSGHYGNVNMGNASSQFTGPPPMYPVQNTTAASEVYDFNTMVNMQDESGFQGFGEERPQLNPHDVDWTYPANTQNIGGPSFPTLGMAQGFTGAPRHASSIKAGVSYQDGGSYNGGQMSERARASSIACNAYDSPQSDEHTRSRSSTGSIYEPSGNTHLSSNGTSSFVCGQSNLDPQLESNAVSPGLTVEGPPSPRDAGVTVAPAQPDISIDMHRICPFLRVAPAQVCGKNAVLPERWVLKLLREACARCLLQGYDIIAHLEENQERPLKRSVANYEDDEDDESIKRPVKRRRRPSNGGRQGSKQDADDSKQFEHLCTWYGCSARFNRNGHLQRHIKTVHLKIKDVKCYVASCSQVFSRRDNMTQHCTLTHGAVIDGTLKGEAFVNALEESLNKVGEDLADCYRNGEATIQATLSN